MAPSVPKLRLRDILDPAAHLHLARGVYRPGAGGEPHTHDFAEVFWIEAGRCLHHVNDRRQTLEPGDLVLMRPADVHGLRAPTRQRFVLVNVAFDRRELTALRQRYFDPRVDPAAPPWPWEGDTHPATYRLDPPALARLDEQVRRLLATRPTRLALHRFLLHVLGEVTELTERQSAVGSADRAPALPGWLAAALETMRDDPAALAAGVPALAKLAHRSREHVSRTIRAATGITATELINQYRLDQAAADLRMTDKPILDVAADCGLANLGYFYQRFKQRFGVTPRRYRLREQALVRGRTPRRSDQ